MERENSYIMYIREVSMGFEWMRFITILLVLVAIIQLFSFYKRIHNPGVFAPISWLVLIVAFDIFKFIVRNDLRYYNISLFWVNSIFILGIILLIVSAYLFRDIKTWIFKR